MSKAARFLGLTVFVALCSIHPGRWTSAGSISLYVANEGNGTVRQFSDSGADLGNFATGLNSPAYVTADPAGNVYVSNNGGYSVNEYSPQGNLMMTISTPFHPGDAVVTASGNILVADYFGGKVYQYSPTGQSLGLFSNPGLGRADFMALDSHGNLYVTDFGFHATGFVEKISPTGVDEGHFLTNVGGIAGIAFDSSGNLYAAFESQFSYNGTDMIREYSASGQDLGLITATGIDLPYGLTFGPNGNLFVANFGNNTIHEFSPSGTDLGVFASTGLSDPRSLVFSSATPEPSSAVLLSTAGVVLFISLHLCRQRAVRFRGTHPEVRGGGEIVE